MWLTGARCGNESRQSARNISHEPTTSRRLYGSPSPLMCALTMPVMTTHAPLWFLYLPVRISEPAAQPVIAREEA